MAMVGNQFTDVPVPSAFLAPDIRIRTSYDVDYEMGGIGIGDPSQGLQVQVWECRVQGGVIQVSPEGMATWTDVTSDTGITEVSLAFDQNMRPTIAYVAGGVAKMYWYDSDSAAYVTSTFPDAVSPVVLMDDKRTMEIGLNDILLFYIREGRIWHRVQRERFLIEYNLRIIPPASSRIQRAGMNVGNRVQIEFNSA